MCYLCVCAVYAFPNRWAKCPCICKLVLCLAEDVVSPQPVMESIARFVGLNLQHFILPYYIFER